MVAGHHDRRRSRLVGITVMSSDSRALLMASCRPNIRRAHAQKTDKGYMYSLAASQGEPALRALFSAAAAACPHPQACPTAACARASPALHRGKEICKLSTLLAGAGGALAHTCARF